MPARIVHLGRREAHDLSLMMERWVADGVAFRVDASVMRNSWMALALVAIVAPTSSRAQSTEPVHDPQGSVVVGVTFGASFTRDRELFSAGGQVGYSVVDGLVPGIRGLGFFGDIDGGEILGTLSYTPPLQAPVLPFVVGEGGHRWESDIRGAIAGGGGGLHLGSPGSRFGLRAGVVYNRFFAAGGIDIIRPLVLFSFRF
ncbi:MAG: hypothetical protein ACFB9M_17065 [Myxococcota bacterium]